MSGLVGFAATPAAVADQTEGGQAVATGGVSQHKDHVFWWTPSNSGDAGFTPDLLVPGEDHSSTTKFKVGKSEVAITCTISNINGAFGLITKVPTSSTAQAGWSGEGLGVLYNNGDPDTNRLANGLLFGFANNAPMPDVIRAGVARERAAGIEGPWTQQVRKYNGLNPNGTVNINNMVNQASWTNKIDFDMACEVAVDGQAVPTDGLVVGDAESLSVRKYYNSFEQIVAKPAGEGAESATWHVLDQWTGCGESDEIYVDETNTMTMRVNPNTSRQYGECGGNGRGPAEVLMLKGSNAINVQMVNHQKGGPGGSASAVAVGVYLTSDFGDAPASYGLAGNFWGGTWTDPIEKGERFLISEKYADNYEVHNEIYNGGRYYWGAEPDAPDFILGAKRDTESPGDVVPGKNANSDDKDKGEDLDDETESQKNDEDSFKNNTDISANLVSEGGKVKYSLEVPCKANKGTGYVSGWIDWNMNGEFDASEKSADATCEGEATTTLNWETKASDVEPWLARTDDVAPGKHASATSYMRLRISSDKGEANDPTGIGIHEGEVEDHRIRWKSPVAIEKSVEVEDGKDPVPGTKVTWTVKMTNTGNIDYTDSYPMAMTDDMSDVLKIVDGVTVVGATKGKATVEGDKLNWLGAIAAGETVEVTYSGIIAKYDDGVATNSAALASDPENPVSTDTELPLIKVAKSSTPAGPVNEGDTVTYTVTVTNEGPGAAKYAKAIDDISKVTDDGTLASGPSADKGSATLSGTNIEWTGELAAGESATITYTVTANGKGDKSLDNTASVDPSYVFEDKAEEQKPAETTTPITTPLTPIDQTTAGEKGQPQETSVDGMFDVPEGSTIASVKLVDPATGKPTDATTVTTDEGTYELKDGKVVFTPNPDFVGTPTPIQVQATDNFGNTATATYQPVVGDTEETTVEREITYTYLTEDGQTASKTVTQSVTYERKQTPKFDENGNQVLDEDGKPVLEWTTWEKTDDSKAGAVDSPVFADGENAHLEGWTPDQASVPAFEPELDENGKPKDGEPVHVVYEPSDPVGENDSSFAGKGQAQSGKPTFTTTTATSPNNKGEGDEFAGENDIAFYYLLDEKGERTRTTIAYDENGNRVGTYEIADDGTVTFTPDSSDYVGKPKPATVQAIDANGRTATAEYQPECVDNTATKTVARTVTFTYLTEDGEEVSEDVVQEVTFEVERDVDPATGALSDPDWTKAEPQEFPAVEAPEKEGWTPNTETVPAAEVKATDEDSVEHVVYQPADPTADPDETWGVPGEAQTGKPAFHVTTPTQPNGEPNTIEKIELLDADGNPAQSVTVPEGTYALNEDGTITFTPSDPAFVGDPTPVAVRGTDSNGKSVDTTYAPHIVDNKETVSKTRTIEYRYIDENGEEVTEKVEQTLTFTREGTIKRDAEGNPVMDSDGKPVIEYGEWTPQDSEEAISPDKTADGWTPDRESVQSTGVTPDNWDTTFTDELVVYNHKGIVPEGDESYGLPGQDQTGEPTFEVETKTQPNGKPNKIEKLELIDPATGEPTDKPVKIPGQGTYTLNEDGTVTFTPEDGFVGDPTPILVEGTDSLGNKARAPYQPHVVDPTEKGEATRTIHATYLTEDGTQVTNDVQQSVELTRKAKSVDPETGEVTEWGPWEKAELPSAETPDEEAGEGWTTKDTIEALEVDEPGDKGIVNVVYTPTKPVATPDETFGGKGEAQTGEPEFAVKTAKQPNGEPNRIEKVELLDPESGEPTDTVTIPGQGTYALNEDGTITFTPEADFVGDPTPVKVRGTDSLGQAVETTYTPHVVDNTVTETVTRTVTFTYLTEDGEEVSEDVVQTLTFETTRPVDPETGELGEPDWDSVAKQTFPEVSAPKKEGWTPNTATVPAAEGAATDEDIVEHVVYQPEAPTATPDETFGGKGEAQTGTPAFEVTTPTQPNGKPNTIEKIELINPATGEPTTDPVTIPGQGTYSLNEDGTVTFTPEPEFIGDPTPILLKGTDSLGNSVRTSYQPHVVDNSATETATRTVTFTYLTEDGEEVSEDVVQTLTFETTRSVDPKTGELGEPDWDSVAKQTFPEVSAPKKEGWTPNTATVPAAEVAATDEDIVEHVVYQPEAPTATPDETFGGKGEAQTGEPAFEVTTPTQPNGKPNVIEKVELLDPESGEPADTVTIPGQGTYTLNEDGTVTFTPESDFVGDPTPVKVRGTDSLGQSAETTYTPHVVDNVQNTTVDREISYEYNDGTPVKDSEGNPLVVVQSTEFTRTGTVDPKTGKVTYSDEDWTPVTEGSDAWGDSESPAVDGWTPDQDVVPGMSVKGTDDPADIVVVYNPKGIEATPDETWGGKGEPQTGEPAFEPQTKTLPNGEKNEIVKRQLIDPSTGEPTDKPVTIKGQGTYTMNEDGTITFEPEKDFVGNPQPVGVVGTDKLGKSAKTTYQPHVVDNSATKTVTRTVTFTYLTEDGEEVTKDVVQTVTFATTCAVNPETGEVSDPDWTKVDPKEFDEVEAPEVEGWTPDRATVPALEVKATDSDSVEHVVYQPEAPTGTPDETFGGKGEAQTGTPAFEVTTPTQPNGKPNVIEKVELLDPESGEPTDTVTIPGQGTYTLNEDGTIVFTPKPEFVGDPTPVKVRGTDSNGKSAETTYTPHVVDNVATKTVTRTVTFTYLTEDGEEATKDVEQTVTFTVARDVDPETGKVSDPDWTKAEPKQFDEVTAPAVEGWTPDRATVPAAAVKATDDDCVEHVVYQPAAPKATDDETFGGKGEKQTGEPSFTLGTATMPDGSDNEIVERKLLDPATGKQVDEVAIPGQGTYALNEDGTVTFTPEPEFVGDPTPIGVIGTDKLGQYAKGVYTPHVVDNVQNTTVDREISYEYNDGTPVKDAKGNPLVVVQSADFTRTGTVDPKTGEVTYAEDGSDWQPVKDGVDTWEDTESPAVEGWTPDQDVVPGMNVKGTDDPADVVVVYNPKDMTAEADETWGAKGQAQTGEPSFALGTTTLPDGSANEVVSRQLVDPATGEPTDSPVTIPGQGTYTLNPDGTIVFTPEPEFVGDPQAIEVVGADKLGKSAKTTYQPHVVDNVATKTVTRTVTFTYLTEDGEEVTKDVEQTVTFEVLCDVDPATGAVADPDWTKAEPQEFPTVEAPEVEGWTPDRATVAAAAVKATDKDIVEHVVYQPKAPTATPDETFGAKGQPQTGTPEFTLGTPTLPDGSENAIVKRQLIDPSTGEPTDEPVTIKGQGTYTLNPDGTITFTPEPDFVGDPQAIGIVGTDKLGNSAKTTYQPHVVDNAATKTVTRTVTFTYLTEDGEKVTKDVVQEVTFTVTCDVDPATGALADPDWTKAEPQEFDEVQAPEVEGWTPDRATVPALEVKATDGDSVEHVVYQQNTYWVTYIDPATGRTIMEKTTQPVGDGEPAAPADPTREGFVFDGWDRSVDEDGNVTYTAKWVEKTYWVTYVDPDGTTIYLEKTTQPVSAGEPAAPADPTRDGHVFVGWDREVDAEGNVTYTAIWTPEEEPAPATYWVTYIDPATGRTIMEKTTQPKGEGEPAAPADPTREGFVFDGWDRTEDEDGNVIYTAKWIEQIWVTYIDPETNEVYKIKTPFAKGATEPEAPAEPTRNGFVFDGWDRTVDEAGNVTYLAKWTPVLAETPEPTQPVEEPTPTPTISGATPVPVSDPVAAPVADPVAAPVGGSAITTAPLANTGAGVAGIAVVVMMTLIGTGLGAMVARRRRA